MANRARNLNRDRRPRRQPDDPLTDGALSHPDGPVRRLLCDEQLQRLADAMEQLPFEQREVVALHMYGDLTFRAIGSQQGVPPETVKSRYRYGLKKLRLILNSEETS